MTEPNSKLNIAGSGGGGKKGGGGHTPTEADDTLQSFQRVEVIDLLCEGPIEGIVDTEKNIYLGENIILHHVHNRLSSRDVYKWGGYYHKMTAMVLRHESR